MALQITPEQVKQQREIGHVKRRLRDTAVELAVLGEVDSARDLLDLLFSTTGETIGLFQNGLSFVWRATGQWPKGIPEQAKSDTAFQELRQGRVKQGLPHGGDACNESGLKACLEVKDVYGADSTTGTSAMSKGVRLVQALEISMQLFYAGGTLESESGVRRSARIALQSSTLNDVVSPGTEPVAGPRSRLTVPDLDAQSAEIVRMVAARWEANSQLRYLTEAESLWPYYLQGLLADALSLDTEDLRAKGQALVQAFSQRVAHGFVPSMLAEKSMGEVLETANKNTNDRMAEEGQPRGEGTMFKSGTSDEELETLEQRLQTVLPDDYKEFLRITDGFGIDDAGIYNGFFPDPALHFTSRVKWDEDEYFQLPVDLLQLPHEIEQLATSHWERRSTQPNGHLDWDGALPIFDRVLELGTRDIDNIWLVHPQLVEQCRSAYHEMYTKARPKQKKLITLAMESFAGSKEAFEQMHWCCVTWAAGGSACMTAYASFRDYIEGVTMESMECKYVSP